MFKYYIAEHNPAGNLKGYKLSESAGRKFILPEIGLEVFIEALPEPRVYEADKIYCEKGKTLFFVTEASSGIGARRTGYASLEEAYSHITANLETVQKNIREHIQRYGKAPEAVRA